MKKWMMAVTVVVSIAVFFGCGTYDAYPPSGEDGLGGFPAVSDGAAYEENYRYDSVEEQGFVLRENAPSAAFSLDRNTAAYSYVRRQINDGMMIAPDSVRIEEMINYFDYASYPLPAEGEEVALNARVAACPWNADHKLLSVGLRTEDISLGDVPNNLVFLIDVSGSMAGSDRIGLVKETFRLLVSHLKETDRVSVVTYANNVNVLFRGYSGADGVKIMSVIDDLQASGSTAGGEGLERAYAVAEECYIEGGNNRVIIASDGDFNVGVNSKGEVSELIAEKANGEREIFLSVFGYGMYNTRDDLLETLARNGNGNYAYIDSLLEAEKAVVKDIDGTLNVVMKNAKANVTFTEAVQSYRLIGYDTKILSVEEWEDEKTDTGEIGSGLTVTALFEFIPSNPAAEEGVLAEAAVRYQPPADGANREVSVQVSVGESAEGDAAADLSFVTCVAEFGLILRQSAYRGEASLIGVLGRLAALEESGYLETDEFKAEFYRLVKIYQSNNQS